jgi:hypothetical protein
MHTGKTKFVYGAAAFMAGAFAAFIASAAPDFPGVPGRGGPPTTYPGVPGRDGPPNTYPGVPGRDAGPPPVTFPYQAEPPRRGDVNDRDYGREIATDPFAIDSADSCMLKTGGVYVSATGSCPGGKTCTLQERRKGSTQPWKNSIVNPNPIESQNEYRPDCI